MVAWWWDIPQTQWQRWLNTDLKLSKMCWYMMLFFDWAPPPPPVASTWALFSLFHHSMFIVYCCSHVFGPCFAMEYLVSFLVHLQSSCWGRERELGCFLYFVFFMVGNINVMCLFIMVSCVGLLCVMWPLAFSDHLTQLRLKGTLSTTVVYQLHDVILLQDAKSCNKIVYCVLQFQN